MEISLRYGKGFVTIDLPSTIDVDVLSPSDADAEIDYGTFLEAFTESSGPQFFARGPVLFVVNDAYRHTPTEGVLAWIERSRPGIVDKSSYLIATGAHGAPTAANSEEIFGSLLARVKGRVGCHVASDLKSMRRVGEDRFGEPVYVNARLFEFERICVIGSVEPHYFAGYTGGRKAIFPGLADLATIERNHNLANSLEARPLRLDGNPVADHLKSLLPLFEMSRVYSIQLVVDSRGRTIGLFAGSLDESFSRAVGLAEKTFARDVAEPYDAVIGELLPPLDRNLYQSQKALENCQAGAADGGTVITVSACEEGVGSRYFFDQAITWNLDANLPGDGVLRFGSHKLSRVNAIGRRVDVRLYSELDDDAVRRVFFEPVKDIGRLLAEKALGKKRFRAAVVHDAGHTVLRKRKNQ